MRCVTETFTYEQITSVIIIIIIIHIYVQYNDCVVFIFTKSRNKTIKSIKMMLKNILMLKHPITDIYIFVCENEKMTFFSTYIIVMVLFLLSVTTNTLYLNIK